MNTLVGIPNSLLQQISILSGMNPVSPGKELCESAWLKRGDPIALAARGLTSLWMKQLSAENKVLFHQGHLHARRNTFAFKLGDIHA